MAHDWVPCDTVIRRMDHDTTATPSIPVRPGLVGDPRFRRTLPVQVVNSICEESHHLVKSCAGTRNAHAEGPWPTCRPREPTRPTRRRKTTPSRHTS